MLAISTTFLADGIPDSTARLRVGGDVIEMSYDDAMRMLEAARPNPDTPAAELETKIVGLLFLLFQHKRRHSVTLDGVEIGTVIGAAPVSEYFHYINGHTIAIDATSRKCEYTSLTYVDAIIPQEIVRIEGSQVVAVCIKDFMGSEDEYVTPKNPRFHRLLEHVADMLESAVLRHIYGNVPGEEDEGVVDKESIERGYAQFGAVMFG